MPRSVSVVLLLGMLAGCATTTPHTPQDALSGHLVMAPRMQVFVPCEAENPLWVVADGSLQERLETRYAELVDEPGEEAFAVVRGTMGPGLDCEWCRDFPGSFQLNEVIEYRVASERDCR